MSDNATEVKGSAAAPVALASGSLVAGRFEIERLLGSGGMGQVYRAIDRELNGEVVALKILHHNLAQDQSIFERFRNEVSVARTLAHPNIVRTHDLGKAPEGFYYITMEFIEGSSLKERLDRGGPLAAPAAAVLLSAVLSAVGYAHSRGVIHRDIKPANILLLPSGEIKLADFGTARLMTSQLELTPAGQLIGTPSYMSPEQVRGEELDPRCDIYALGIIGYELVVGKRPFDGESFVTTAYKHVNEALPKMAAGTGPVPRWYEAAIEKATSKQKEQRFATALDFSNALKSRESRFTKPAPHAISSGESFGKGVFIFGVALFLLLAVFLWSQERPDGVKSLPPIASKSPEDSGSTAAPPAITPAAITPAASSTPRAATTIPTIASIAETRPSAPSPAPLASSAPPAEVALPGEIFFRAASEISPSERIPFSNLAGVRWTFSIDPQKAKLSNETLGKAALFLQPLNSAHAAVKITGQVLSLGTQANPELRIGGTIPAGTGFTQGIYAAEVRVGSQVLASSKITFF